MAYEDVHLRLTDNINSCLDLARGKNIVRRHDAVGQLEQDRLGAGKITIFRPSPYSEFLPVHFALLPAAASKKTGLTRPFNNRDSISPI